MIGIGIAVIWVAYTGGLYAYCLLTGKNVTIMQLVSTSVPKWPPPLMTPDMILPGAGGAGTAPPASDSTGSPVASSDPSIQNAITKTAPALGGLGGGSLPAR